VTDLVSIFCEIDDFCKDFFSEFKISKKLTANKSYQKGKQMRLSKSEIMTISIYYHFSGYATFKDYYTKHVTIYLKKDFPKLVSYNRFIELRKKIVIPLLIFLVTRKLSSCTGFSIIDSFKLDACHIRRASSHKTLKGFAKKGKTSVGWFFGMKVHLIVNHRGEIVSFYVSSGNVSDNNQNILFKLTKNITGKLFGDKGYIVNQKIFEKLYLQGVHLITKIRKNMKNKLMEMEDKLFLQKRGVIESIGDILKQHLGLEHTRHRSSWGFFLNVLSSLTAYQMRDKKPSIPLSLGQNLLYA